MAMKSKALQFVLLCVLITGFLSGCRADNNTSHPSDIPDIIFTDTVRIYLPRYYNADTGCYGDNEKTIANDTNASLQEVNEFSSNARAKIQFLLILKPNSMFIYSDEALALYQLDTEHQKWLPVQFHVENSLYAFGHGSILTMNNTLKNLLTKEKCVYQPETPISLIIDDDSSRNRTYRLYTWGPDMNKITNDSLWAIIGNYAEFTLSETAP